MGSENRNSTEEMNEYLNGLMTGKVKVEGVEGTVVRRLQEDDAEFKRLDGVISQLSQQLETAKIRAINFQGKREAYIQLLVDEEMERRKKKSFTDPTKIRIKGSILSEDEKNTLGNVLGMPVSEAQAVLANVSNRKEF